jgi:hypothetical protein
MRFSRLVHFASLVGATAVISCGSTGPGTADIEAPLWDCPQAPTARVQGDVGGFGGIGARPDDSYITLRWYIGTEESLIGYQMFRRSDESAVYRIRETILLTPDQLRNRRGEIIEWTDEETGTNHLYNYVLFALDSDSNRSVQSDTLSYSLKGKPVLVTPPHRSVIADTTPIFVFGHNIRGSFDLLMKDFVLRVEKFVGSNWRLVWVSPLRGPRLSTVDQEKTAIEYADGGYIVEPTLSNGFYRWRVDFTGIVTDRVPGPPCYCVYDTTRCADADPSLLNPNLITNAGSASRWQEFTVELP